jgi:glucose uptake protein GlcU
MAYVYATITGFLDGSLAVPFKLANVSAGGVALQYIPSFGLSALVVPAVVFALYNVIRGRQIALVANECKVAAFPGVSSGILWASANYLSVIATHYLGIEVGFPLTQTCLVFTAAWGILYFKEINLRKTGKTVRFTSGIVTIVIGAYLLGSSTKA